MEEKNTNILIDFEPISRRVYLLPDKDFYQILINSGIHITSLCGGMGKCGKCTILIQNGKEFLNTPTAAERDFLDSNSLEKGWRLACQTKVKTELINTIKMKTQPQFRIYLPDELLLEDFNILTSGINKFSKINPNIKKIYLKVEKPTLEKPIPDIERILSSTSQFNISLQNNNQIKFQFEILKKIPQLLREDNNGLTLTLWNEHEIIECESGNKTKDNYGIAFDIGTTTIVGYLVNLNNGKTYSVSSTLNPQTAFGEDVVTRITYTKENVEGLQKLNSLVIEALNKIITKTCEKAKIKPHQIYEATVVGNSVMHHIFLGLSPVSIGLSPYVPVTRQSMNVKPRDLNLNIYPLGNVYLLPLIAGYVGADTMGVIISSEIESQSELTLAIDIGTNGEIVIGNKDFLATGSCAAGSALEGAHINCGMRAAAGAIDRIEIEKDTFDVTYSTIKNRKPLGICGSGLIDGVAEMLKANIITRSGTFSKNLNIHERIIKKGNITEFIIAKENETSLNMPITISQKDIREIQMAKGAFYSGTRLILNYLNRKHHSNLEIQQIFLAGAFGNYINKKNAKFIGMIPDIPDDNVYQIGNAAGMGAQNCLLNKNLRIKANELRKKIEYVEIALEKDFQMEFAESMYFPHLKLHYFPNLKEYNSIPKR